MATLAEQTQGERMARVALSLFAEPNASATGRVFAQVGGIETLRLIESDDPVPGLARADALMWRERITNLATEGRKTHHRHRWTGAGRSPRPQLRHRSFTRERCPRCGRGTGGRLGHWLIR